MGCRTGDCEVEMVGCRSADDEQIHPGAVQGVAFGGPEEGGVQSLGATQTEILTKVGIPRAMPYLFASLKVAITLAFIGSVISETVGGNNGIGFLMLSASARNDAPTTFAGLFAGHSGSTVMSDPAMQRELRAYLDRASRE